MKSSHSQDGILRSYLLGGMSEESQEQLENRLMTEQQLLEDLEVAEEELVDDYVCGFLEASERRNFERLFLSLPSRSRQVSFASDLRAHIAASPQPVWPEDESSGGGVLPFVRRLASGMASPAWQPAMAAVLVVAVVSAVWLAAGNIQLERRLEELGASQNTVAQSSQALQEQLTAERNRATSLDQELRIERAQISSLTEEIDALRRAAGGRTTASSLVAIATMWLEPGGLIRGGGATQRLIVPSDAKLVHLLLDIGVDDYAAYRASLHDENLDEFWSQSQLSAADFEGRVAIELVIPAELLPHGDFSIRLSGVTSGGELELAGRYPFRVLED